jgi:hypothetical protein
LRAAHSELEERCDCESEIRDAWCLPSGDFKPLRHWTDEVWPLLIFANHKSLPDTELVQFSEKGASGVDWTLRSSNGAIAHFEVTTTYSYDDRLRDELMTADGSVFQFTPVARDRQSGRVIYTEPHCARDSSEAFAEWRNRLVDVLSRKRRPNYGSGVTLLVYAYGMSGDFERWRTSPTIDDIIAMLPREALENAFDRTIIMSWHPAWIRTVSENV